MTCRWKLLILALSFFLIMVLSVSADCPQGFLTKKKNCIDIDECNDAVKPCGQNTNCTNTNGSYYCQCKDGFKRKTGEVNFKTVACEDIHECLERKDICGLNAKCENAIPYYSCTCDDGFISTTGNKTFRHDQNATCEDINECHKGNPCGQNGLCNNTQGSYYCMCKAGFTNYGNKTARCTESNCDVFKALNGLEEKLPIVKQLNKSCQELTGDKSQTEEDLLKRFQSEIDQLLSSKFLKDRRTVSIFLDLVEIVLRLIGAVTKMPGRNTTSTHTELKMLVHHGPVISKRNTTLSTKHAQLDIQMEMAAGEPAYYPGFTTVSLMSYSNLEDSTDGFFDGIKPQKNQSFKINSKVVTVTVSNKNTSHLKTPVKLTLDHLIQKNQTHICVFWDSSVNGGSWSDRGCDVVKSNPEYTVCSCNHLSSFAVLMALYEMENKFELQLITWVGLSISLIFLFISILTFSMIRSIKSTRTTIHLHLCISLFIANLVFLAGISQTANKAGCAVVAGILHFCYLAAFCWMCLEGIQLFRMVVLVFNTTFKTLHMMAVGYGVPAVIVIISVLANSGGYGTKRYCWLNLEIIWSFFGPVCVIIIINIFFFLITVWKLAQKFSSLNPDLDNLHKIKAFTITAVAQLCVLGIMWIFGCFQFEESTVAMSYLFTIFGSLQGVMLFIMHCLFSKQVREEYENILARFCVPQKKSYKEFNYSSKAQASKSSQDTGESHF
ncbi:adhesion G protein-coupled receptor E1-like [Pundamilia nyererei]|uniref:Adhesion G protein-coupled receptor E1-like n=1 Tax=Pundamilia nyererei TaxID=303518 RepID=A0A9Y3RRR2_9CICH|nr:PREDICTED: adhesion G protein-coupled receptor E1-like [Pundamilia nyererei]